MLDEELWRVTTERALVDEDGLFGFLVVWSVQNDWANVKVCEVTAEDGDAPLFLRAGWRNSQETVRTPEHAESYLTGYIKWDGCAELDQGCPHWCGVEGFVRHVRLLRYLYHRAYELMGRSPEDPWPEDAACQS